MTEIPMSVILEKEMARISNNAPTRIAKAKDKINRVLKYYDKRTGGNNKIPFNSSEEDIVNKNLEVIYETDHKEDSCGYLIDESFINDLDRIQKMQFFRLEYTKRNYYMSRQSQNNSRIESDEIQIIAKLKAMHDNLKNNHPPELARKCNKKVCYFNPESNNICAEDEVIFLKYPFYYNFDCRNCSFKNILMSHIIAWHHIKHPAFNDSFNDLR